MSRETAIDKLSDKHKKELDKKLVEYGFNGYIPLTEWLQSLGYEIGKSSVHRYGKKLEQQHKEAEVRKAFNLTAEEQKLVVLYRTMSKVGQKRLVLRLFYEKDKIKNPTS